ncbi:hypothetical protein A3J90_01170 [candidate division WOR-1 bacterium RIFOXYC2_FULL_37_10]|uniref:NAD kinase n=1 Tax=candidate division WOR-1 bacterium RIFOXYB2_FULL_37_13 TaxID=1802579 RepID=A0A1F4SSX9_UNCSA|nr:MAG: hypothetical protein A2246_05470 [candidate division WOR-1 bacterium RIFOXYA2_FULL_37_7]OGC23519.1 MAG: hypothetical protein A2310_02835 [candidate division WOR-1 bacterium RIFOXYB2_FULL_37_13]OGC35732.1 MAG: hypothetical protein A3J90_01170 [candidate division WOR-1 bacterium RIFOXYC2_FULL_37_10]
MKKVSIIHKKEDKLIAGTAKQLTKELSPSFVFVADPRKADFIITLGGDGTVLRAAHIISQHDIPLLTVQLGGLGLLTECSLGELPAALESIKNKKYQIDSRLMLKVHVVRKNKIVKELFALNDAVVCKNDIARIIKLRAFLGDDLLGEYAADGIIASTPTGSTAYNFAVNGPILPVHSKSYILSPICPHRATDRSIVLEEDVTLAIIKGKDVLLTVDGQQTLSLKPDDIVKIGVSKEKTSFIRFKEYDIWGLLRSKLGWGT